MDQYERFYRRSLRDVLVGQRMLTAEQADELAESAYESNETFGHAVVDAGHLTAYELVKVVAAHYQMPVLPLAGYDYDAGLLEGIPAATLFQYQVLPVGRFGRAWSFAVIEPPSRECLIALKEYCGPSIFFFVADSDAVHQLIAQHVKVVDAKSDKSWQSIFDSADQRVLEEIGDGVDDSL